MKLVKMLIVFGTVSKSLTESQKEILKDCNHVYQSSVATVFSTDERYNVLIARCIDEIMSVDKVARSKYNFYVPIEGIEVIVEIID